MKEKLLQKLNDIVGNLLGISDNTYENRELGDEEYESIELLVEYLHLHDFKVEEIS